jgi:phage terminase large subunit-like protein
MAPARTPPVSSRSKPSSTSTKTTRRAGPKSDASPAPAKSTARKRPTPPKRPDLNKRWRPSDRKKRPVCGFTLDGKTCKKSGPHYCEPRADRVVRFHAEVLVHTKGRWARHAFVLEGWQEWDIVRPLFGEVVWSEDWHCYVRRYRLAYIVLARKNGKSEMVAGMVLVLLVGDDEQGAEIYGAARDKEQASKVGQVVNQMREMSPLLNGDIGKGGRLKLNKSTKRIYDLSTASFFDIIAADALAELGHNPHASYIDEVLSQRDDSLFHALRTAMGARVQPMFVLATTETNDPAGFGAVQIDEAEKIQEDPSRAPHIFAYVRKLPQTDEELRRLRKAFRGHPDLPVSTDPWDERNWRWPNPALGSFKTLQSMREEAVEARNNPVNENAFRQFQLNQRVNQVTRYMPMSLWKQNAGEVAPRPAWLLPKMLGKKAWAGLDLSAKLDLTAWTVLTVDGWAWWRFWVPESVVPKLDEHTGGQFGLWVRDGWVKATDGDTIDYDTVYADIERDAGLFRLAGCTYDKWSGEPVRQEIEHRTGLTMDESSTSYDRMTAPMQELMRILKARELQHGNNPVAQWMADNLNAKYPRDDPDRVRPVKPDRQKTGIRVDGMVSLLMAIDGRMRDEQAPPSVYESRGLSSL